MNDNKILDKTFYDGYHVQKELVDGTSYGTQDIETEIAYNPNGDYIGEPSSAKYYCEEKGIAPETKNDDVKVCSIGFCKKEQKWYGWSHRAIHGFGVGDIVKKGDCAYIPDDLDELLENWSWSKSDIHADYENSRIVIRHDMVTYPHDNPLTDELGEPEPAEPEYQYIYTGKGEWTAETLEDAKQMAIDFSDGVD